MFPKWFNRARRSASQRFDQATLRGRSWFPSAPPNDWSGQASPAVLTVNYNTTEALKLMLLTLSQQSAAKRLARVVLVDQCSRDDPEGFLPRLAATCPRILLITRRWRLHHAPGMRAGQRALARSEQDQPAFSGANVLLYLDRSSKSAMRPIALPSPVTVGSGPRRQPSRRWRASLAWGQGAARPCSVTLGAFAAFVRQGSKNWPACRVSASNWLREFLMRCTRKAGGEALLFEIIAR